MMSSVRTIHILLIKKVRSLTRECMFVLYRPSSILQSDFLSPSFPIRITTHLISWEPWTYLNQYYHCQLEFTALFTLNSSTESNFCEPTTIWSPQWARLCVVVSCCIVIIIRKIQQYKNTTNIPAELIGFSRHVSAQIKFFSTIKIYQQNEKLVSVQIFWFLLFFSLLHNSVNWTDSFQKTGFTHSQFQTFSTLQQIPELQTKSAIYTD